MPTIQLIADCGSTKAEWVLLKENGKTQKIMTQGLSPYFLSAEQITEILRKELVPKLKNTAVEAIYFYGTGCALPKNASIIKKSLTTIFPQSKIAVDTDILGAAKALCQHEQGVTCILGTGVNSAAFNGKKLTTNSPGLGYILGDEGSGAYLGKKVIQYYLYKTFDEELKGIFEQTFQLSAAEIMEGVYKQPLPNRFLATFAPFLSENRGHYMIENIIEDGLNDFFFTHLCKYREIWKFPVHFTGGIAFAFKDIIKQLCFSYEFELGKIEKSPIKGLICYHQSL